MVEIRYIFLKNKNILFLHEKYFIITILTFRFDTLDPRVSNVPRGTRADRLVVGHPAVRVGGARVGHRAGVQALPVDAGVVQWTFGVISAFGCIGRHYVWCNCNMQRVSENSWQ